MKICFIDWFAYGLFNPRSRIVFGGAQIQLFLLGQELAKAKKFNVSFLTDNQTDNRINNCGKIKVYQFLRSLKTPGIKGRLLQGYWYFFTRLLLEIKKINASVY